MPHRRTVLAGLLAAGAARPARAGGPRVATLDWSLASTLVAMGRPPMAVGEPRLYRRWVTEPALPLGVEDLGLRDRPSLERLSALAPDLILVNDRQEAIRPLLARIAPVVACNAYTAERRPLALGTEIVRDLGRRLDAGAEAEALLARADRAFDAARARLAARARGGVLVVTLLDERHLNVYGSGSLFTDVLARIGVANAWDRPTTPWGTSTVGPEALAGRPEADLVAISPVPAAAAAALAGAGLWGRLAALRTGRTVTLPTVWPFGDVVAAVRFATLLGQALGADA